MNLPLLLQGTKSSQRLLISKVVSICCGLPPSKAYVEATISVHELCQSNYEGEHR